MFKLENEDVEGLKLKNTKQNYWLVFLEKQKKKLILTDSIGMKDKPTDFEIQNLKAVVYEGDESKMNNEDYQTIVLTNEEFEHFVSMMNDE